MKLNNVLKFSLFLILFVFIFPINSNAKSSKDSDGFTQFINAPRKYFSTSNNSLSDVIITIVGDNALKSVKFYTVDSNGNNKKEISLPSNTSNKKNHIYTLSHKDLLKESTHYFYVEITDENGYTNNSNFRVFCKTKKSDGNEQKYYSIDDSPRFKFYSASNAQLCFTLSDLDGAKSLKIQDMNNNKQVYNADSLSKGNQSISINIKDIKASDGLYKLKISSVEADSNQTSTQNISFKVSDKAMVITDTSSQYDFSFNNVTFKKVAEYNPGVPFNYIQGMDYADGNYYITTYNYVGNLRYSSILKFNSSYNLIKSTGNILQNAKLNGIMCSSDKNKLFVSNTQTNTVRVFDSNTLNSLGTENIGNINTSPRMAMSYDRKNQRYVFKSSSYFYVVDANTKKVIKKIPKKSGDNGQDICVSGDYIIEVMFETSTFNIYSISQGKFLRTDKANYEGITKFGPVNNFEPEGMCQISDNEFIVGVARTNSSGNICIMFYKGTLNKK